jgi:hypothetical protein
MAHVRMDSSDFDKIIRETHTSTLKVVEVPSGEGEVPLAVMPNKRRARDPEARTSFSVSREIPRHSAVSACTAASISSPFVFSSFNSASAVSQSLSA